ncbi:hypothetical protein PLEOSDRAFT_1069968 [Pleurotus ostreatus PC15]|uniref:Uncharacterized protein n=1 Tax=Pleurotus ostreatus (strain PC15) TaxID=1137138 RepID=A0A067P7H7_PLEO1|nr:hypothetical protein PLEOSDRAFT_1069968 [Pleurotus ostreatus PC15]
MACGVDAAGLPCDQLPRAILLAHAEGNSSYEKETWPCEANERQRGGVDIISPAVIPATDGSQECVTHYGVDAA